jgi:hypothetical protein
MSSDTNIVIVEAVTVLLNVERFYYVSSHINELQRIHWQPMHSNMMLREYGWGAVVLVMLNVTEHNKVLVTWNGHRILTNGTRMQEMEQS